MTREAIEYFKFHRKIFCEDYLKICPKDSVAYQATLKEKEFYDMAIKALEQEPKTGHWIEKGKTDIAYDMCGYKSWATKYMCNHCGFIHTAIENHGVYSYCPNCGAKMESEVDNGNDD